MNKSLKDKAIKIQGKNYVLVSDRVIYFNDTYPNGKIETKLISKPESDHIITKTKVTPNCDYPQRYFTGYSQAVIGQGMVNKTSALENSESSSCGRALAMMGIGVIDSIASVDEMSKANAIPSGSSEVTEHIIKPIECDVDHDSLPVLTVLKEGANKGKHYTMCPKCKKFHWVT